jgi:hypothetical protein
MSVDEFAPTSVFPCRAANPDSVWHAPTAEPVSNATGMVLRVFHCAVTPRLRLDLVGVLRGFWHFHFVRARASALELERGN